MSESAFVGSLVYVAEAADADCGTNGQVIYTIIDGNEMSKTTNFYTILYNTFVYRLI